MTLFAKSRAVAASALLGCVCLAASAAAQSLEERDAVLFACDFPAVAEDQPPSERPDLRILLIDLPSGERGGAALSAAGVAAPLIIMTEGEAAARVRIAATPDFLPVSLVTIKADGTALISMRMSRMSATSGGTCALVPLRQAD
mgnify:CR=1 FL=1